MLPARESYASRMPMDKPPTAAKTEKAFDALIEEITSSTPSQRSQMMGMACLKAHGKMYAGLWGDTAVFKLAEPAHAEALAVKGAHLFDPSGMNRPMKEWVAVPVAQSKRWPHFAAWAFKYAQRLAK
jgi:hypothetical protein